MVVILAEKPDQARKLAAPFTHKKGNGFLTIDACKEFPEGAKVTWAIGHLVELKTPGEYDASWGKWSLEQLPMMPERFEYKVMSDKNKQFKVVKELLNEADGIIIGTDPAREGENIARLLIMMSGCAKKPVKRLWTSSLTESAIKKGFSELRDGKQTINLYHEAQARQISDWLVGLNASRLYSLLLQKKGIRDVFSVGRVQTPVLKLIYDRHKEIEQFKSEPFFELTAHFTVSNGTYKGKMKGRFQSQEELFKDVHPDIQPDQNHYEATIKSVEVKEKRIPAPKLHSLSTLQSVLNKKNKYSPDQVLKTAQRLYEKGYISYPRTDSQHITNEEFSYLKNRLSNYQACFHLSFEPTRTKPSKRYVNPDKVSDHYAMIPTEKIVDVNTFQSFRTEEKVVYEAIVKSVLAIFMEDYVYDETVITTAIGKTQFFTKGKKEKGLGWKRLYQNDSTEQAEDEEGSSKLPEVYQGQVAEAETTVKEGMTKPPKPYTQGQLITLMKTAGKHINDQDMKNALNEVEGLGTEATRSGIIETLLKREFIEVKKNSVFVTKKGEILCESVQGTILAKPEMTAKWELFLKEIGNGNKSKVTFVENAKKLCHALIEQATKAIDSIDIEKQTVDLKLEDTIAPCPSCQKGHIVDRKSFYGCTGYHQGCRFTLPKKLANKNLSKSNVKKLLEKGKTNLIKGFKSKNGKTFNAYIVWEDAKAGKVTFEFNNNKKHSSKRSTQK
ncbi:type IA DNA topoisomerase [Tuberibacillus sp. Marseille-P3662]|uniref:type IA DNA topoisomerase n=1 Tax=Tuberibacillus sp. Marseille-P3662 TaxID=1965358 RepID=UPI000A1CC617|nr:type IA DNA topoisomerase [Tuberibacillus sp. Marseille-P3662]